MSEETGASPIEAESIDNGTATTVAFPNIYSGPATTVALSGGLIQFAFIGKSTKGAGVSGTIDGVAHITVTVQTSKWVKGMTVVTCQPAA